MIVVMDLSCGHAVERAHILQIGFSIFTKELAKLGSSIARIPEAFC